MPPTLRGALSALCLVGLSGLARADEKSSPIRDEAGLFRADAVAQAEADIAELRQTFDRNLFVQTVAAADPHQRRLFPFLWTRQVNRILDEQARKRADETGVDGIYVVICRHPRDVHVIVRPEEDADFTAHDAEQLRRVAARRLSDAGPDAALRALVRQVRSTLQAHEERGRSRSAVPEYVLVGLLGGGVVLWLLLCLARSRLGAGRTDGYGQARRLPALLGSMFGVPAGLWVYDKLYPPPAGTPEPLLPPPPPAPADVDAEAPVI